MSLRLTGIALAVSQALACSAPCEAVCQEQYDDCIQYNEASTSECQAQRDTCVQSCQADDQSPDPGW